MVGMDPSRPRLELGTGSNWVPAPSRVSAQRHRAPEAYNSIEGSLHTVSYYPGTSDHLDMFIRPQRRFSNRSIQPKVMLISSLNSLNRLNLGITMHNMKHTTSKWVASSQPSGVHRYVPTIARSRPRIFTCGEASAGTALGLPLSRDLRRKKPPHLT